MKHWREVLALAAMVAASWSTPAAAQDAEGRKALVITAENLMAGDAMHRGHAERGGDAQALFAGDVVLYRLVFTNIIDAPVRGIELKDPIPSGLTYVDGSALSDRDDVVIEYSIDGGLTYSTQPLVDVLVDGRSIRRPAPPERYTHIRWLVQDWVQPGVQVTAEFEAKLVANATSQEPGKEPRASRR